MESYFNNNARYASYDKGFINYEVYPFPETPRLVLRGPQPKGDLFFSCLGAAQTFGRFCPKPYPALLSERLQVEVYNFGVSSASPDFFVHKPRILEVANKSKFVIIQVMSAKSISNSLFEPIHGFKATDHNPVNGFDAGDKKYVMLKHILLQLLAKGEMDLYHQIIEETMDNYVRWMKKLFSLISSPKILLWMSKRQPWQPPSNDYEKRINSDFPHFIDEATLQRIQRHADLFVASVSARGTPQLIFDVEGRLIKKNNFYPTPEMHIDAADRLESICQSLL